MTRYRISATWKSLSIGGLNVPEEHTFEFNHKPSDSEVETLARQSMGWCREDQFIPGSLQITEYTDLSDDEEK